VSTKPRVEINVDLSCPAPLPAKDTILLGHGSGGKLSATLMRDIFLPKYEKEGTRYVQRFLARQEQKP
jgi:hypothetical protein